MSRPASTRIPRLPAAARKAGATSVRRCSAYVFTVDFEIDRSVDDDAPGKGTAVFAALRAAGWNVEWSGQQRYGIIVLPKGNTALF